WLRLVDFMLPLDPEHVGPVATLIATSLILFASSWWLSKRIGILSGAIFGLMFLVSPVTFALATYTYPMQFMTLGIVVTLVWMDSVKDDFKIMVGGLGATFVVFSKIQGVGFVIFLIYDVIRREREKLTGLLKLAGWGSLGLISMIILLILLQGFDQTLSIASNYFSQNSAKSQFTGRGEGGMPPFYEYLKEPVVIAALLGIFLTLKGEGPNPLRPFAVAAVFQASFLLAIYAITQRGGPLIYNYSYDAMVLGMIAFAGVLGKRIQVANRILGPLCIFLLLLGLFSALAHAHFDLARHPGVYRPDKIWHSLIGISSSYIAWLGTGLLLLVFMPWKIKSPRMSTVILLLGLASVFAGFFIRAGEGISDSRFKKEISEPYHWLGRKIRQTANRPLWVDVEVGRGPHARKTYRARRVYQLFYNNGVDEVPDKEVFFDKIPSGCSGWLLTNKAENLHQYSNIRRFEYPAFDSNQSEAILLSEISKLDHFPVDVAGLRGNAKLSLRNRKIILEALETSGNLRLILNFNLESETTKRLDKLLLVSSRNIQKPAAADLKLYIQYKHRERHHIFDRKIESDLDRVGVATYIPKNATKLHFGWRVSSQGISSKIVLPEIEVSSLDWSKTEMGAHLWATSVRVSPVNPKLERCAQSIYDSLWKPHGGIHLTRGSYTE
ncbi:MAG: hypothetical protein OER04_00985, partial [Cyclobacteriaceae bacterium]|nr:hypothetical protein [Cyclobacteriaceae bacterium]